MTVTSAPRPEPAVVPVLAWLGRHEPAFATDERQRIVFWNENAARVFGRVPAEVVGLRCHDVVQGRDRYGNLFCYEKCALVATLRRGESVSGCELTVPVAGGTRTLGVAALHVPGRRDGEFALVHVLREVPGVAGHGERPARLAAAAPARPGPPPLTRREREVLEKVAAGLQNKEVAVELGISPATVRNHVHNVLDKLGVHSKLEAVSLAFRCGWVQGPPGPGGAQAEPGEQGSL